MLGFKHSPENIAKFKTKVISLEHKGILSQTHTAKTVGEDTRAKLSAATKEYKNNNPLTPEALANIKAKTTEREGVAVTVLNVERSIKVYNTYRSWRFFRGFTSSYL